MSATFISVNSFFFFLQLHFRPSFIFEDLFLLLFLFKNFSFHKALLLVCFFLKHCFIFFQLFYIRIIRKLPFRMLTFVLIHCSKNEVSIKDFFSKCDQIRSFLRIWSPLLKKSLMENFIFCAMYFFYMSILLVLLLCTVSQFI